jgi:arylsulfatase
MSTDPSHKDEKYLRPGGAFSRRDMLLTGTSALATAGLLSAELIMPAQAQKPAPAVPGGRRPNILVIMGDDIGYWNLSAYSRGMMGYRTPNIDRIAKEGAIFTDLYAQQSCTAGRAAFITGQSCFRTGLLKVGAPGAKEGLSDKDPTLADLLKPLGYATGQFGKNHVGDRNEFLPTVHGFDEFFGNLYHLNAEEEPENPDYPKAPEYPNFYNKYGPRGVLHTFATDVDDPTEDGRFGRVGKQKIEDTGRLTKKRMETVDEEFLGAAMGFIDKNSKANKPFFCWFNSTRMHINTHLKRRRTARLAWAWRPTAWSSTTAWSASCSSRLTTSASPTTPSSFILPTTALKSSRGPMAAPRRFTGKRTRVGKAATASPA